jgi:predicted NBD/HSP70 family sugar kinase
MHISIYNGKKQTIIASFESYNMYSLKRQSRFETDLVFERQMEKIANTIESFGDSSVLKTISISQGGLVDRTKKTVALNNRSRLSDYNGKSAISHLEKKFGNRLPIFFEHSTISPIIAELVYGVAQNETKVMSYVMSAGLGGSVVETINGNEIYVYQTEVGHQIIKKNGRLCPACGQRGCLEAYVGGLAMEERFLSSPDNIKDKRILEDVIEYLSVGAINMYQNFNPDLIVLTGLLINANQFIANSLPKRILELASPNFRDKLRIKISNFVEMGPVYGGLAIAKVYDGQTKFTKIH